MRRKVSKFDKLREEQKAIAEERQKLVWHANRQIEALRNPQPILQDINAEFEKRTELNKRDTAFLLLAVALQCVRQYWITPFTARKDDKAAADEVKAGETEKSDRQYRWYHPSLQQIEGNPVPFDAITGSVKWKLNIGGGFKHRSRTLGHDPLLGWIFGTMNILTGTMTVWSDRTFLPSLESYHIKTHADLKRDYIKTPAAFSKILQYTEKSFLKEGTDGCARVGVSLWKEYIHLRSDINSIVSLPFPLVSAVSYDFAQSLAGYGLDMGRVKDIGQQAAYAYIINSLIAMLHRLYFDKQVDDAKSYEVKTRKILSYSNLIASASNIVIVGIMKYANPKMKAERYLDIGGLLVTIYRLVTDYKFIQQVKQDFIEKEFYDRIMAL